MNLSLTMTNSTAVLGVPENLEPASLIGQVEAYDPDIGDMLSFSIINESETAFSLGEVECSNSGTSEKELNTKCTAPLYTTRQLNHDKDKSTILKVLALDTAQLAVQQEWTVNILNINDAPTVSRISMD